MTVCTGKIPAILMITLALFTLCGCSTSSQVNGSEAPGPVLEAPFAHHFIVPVTINQQTWRFLVDTGASVTIIDQRIADSITQRMSFTDIPAVYKPYFSRIHTVSGTLNQTDFVFLKPVPFSIGTREIRDNDIWLSRDLDLAVQALGVNIDGIIGIDTFRKFNWQVDNDKGYLAILEDAPSAALYDQCVGYVDTYNRAPQFYFKQGDNDVSLYVDTGAAMTYLGKNFIDFLKKNKAATLSSQGVPAAELGGLTRGNDYVITGLSFNDMPLGEINVGENHNELYAVGMDFLSRFRRYAFMPGRMMFCYDASTLARSQQTPVRSIGIRYSNHQIEIFYNQDSVLSKFGLRNGDVILSVNGMAYPPEKIDQVRELLSMKPVGSLALLIRRQGEEKSIRL